MCRSPALHALLEQCFRQHGVKDYYIESAGIAAGCSGRPMDSEMQIALAKRGIVFSHTSRTFERSDFSTFSYIFAATEGMVEYLQAEAPEDSQAKILLMTEFTPEKGDIPDPFSLGEEGREKVLDILEGCSEAILAHIQK